MSILKYLIGLGGGALLGAYAVGEERREEGAVAGGVFGLALGYLASAQQAGGNGGVIGEGNYNSYVLKWKMEINDIYLFYFSYFMPGEKKIAVIVYTDLLLVDVETGVVEVYEDYASTSTVYAQTQDRSRFDRYSAMMRTNWMHMDIWKDDQIIQTLEVEDPSTYDWFSGVVVSPSGKWILTLEVDESESPDKYFLRLYEGSSQPPLFAPTVYPKAVSPGILRPTLSGQLGLKPGSVGGRSAAMRFRGPIRSKGFMVGKRRIVPRRRFR